MEILSVDRHGNHNYVSWLFKLNLALRFKGLFDVATGVDLKPNGQNSDVAVAAWIKKDLEAQTLVGLNVNSDIAKKIANCTSANQMLNKLGLLYGKKSDVALENLQRSFFSFKYDEQKTAVENCLTIQQLAEDLGSEGEVVKESWIITRILGVLPPKLHHFRTSWDNVTGADRNLSKLIERLRLEEDRLNPGELPSSSHSQNALISKKFVKSSKTPIECFKCGMKGHMKNQCRNKPSQKYLTYCKQNYSCNLCNMKGHFARDCTTQKSTPPQSNNRRALINVGFSTSSLGQIESSADRNVSWYQDCGATQHMTPHRENMKNYVKLEVPTLVVIGSGNTLQGIGYGDVDLEAYNGSCWEKIVLCNVLHVPSLSFNLFSVTQVLDKGYTQSANATQSVFKFNGESVVVAEREDDLFKMMLRVDQPEMCLVTTGLKVWHERLAHQNVRYVKEFLKDNNIQYIDDWDNHICSGCVYGKQHNVSHPLNPKVAENVLDVIHVDLCEMNMRSLGGSKYFLLLKDDFSHFKTVYFLKSKDEAPEKLEVFIKLVENQFGRPIKCLRSDNGTEIKNRDTKKLLENLGVFHTKSVAYVPQQNGRIEREMRTVVEAARSALHANNMNENLWAEAVNYAVFTLNQTGKSTVPGSSPADLWFGRKLDAKKLKTFGCTAFVHIPDQKRLKTEKKSRKGHFVGYDTDSSSYRIYLVDNQDVVSSVNVIFDEKRYLDCQISDFSSRSVSHEHEEDEATTVDLDVRPPEAEQQAVNLDVQDEVPGNEIQVNNLQDQLENLEVNDETIHNEHNYGAQVPVRELRDRRRIQIPQRLNDYVINMDQEMGLIHNVINNHEMVCEPVSYDEVMKLPVEERQKWLEAMCVEMAALKENNTWTEVPRPENTKVVTCKWVFKEKNEGEKTIHKARLVARGFQQDENFNFEDTYAPVAKLQTLRILLAVSVQKGMDIHQMDVVCAFLNGDIDEIVYMNKPDGFKSNLDTVLRLNKSLYGLKKSPKYWNVKLNDFLIEQGFKRSENDLCLYVKNGTYILVYVDDILLISNRGNEIKSLKDKFKDTFKMKDLGIISKYLGMQIVKEGNKVKISQTEYIRSVLKKFNMDKCKPVSVPIDPNFTYSGEADPKFEAKCRSLIGALLYVSLCSRPDIMVSVSILARYQHIANENLWIALKRVLRYLQGTVDLSLEFPVDKNCEIDMEAYADADWAGDSTTRKSTSGYIIKLFGCLVLWQSRRQSSVSLSTAEAEYISASEACSDIIWTLYILNDLGIDIKKPITLHEDNQAAIKLTAGQSKRSKHIDIRFHFIRSKVEEGLIELKYVDSNNQLADILTKPLPYPKLMGFRNKLGVK